MSDSKTRASNGESPPLTAAGTTPQLTEGNSESSAVLRRYSRPRILSREPLEAAANVCDPTFGGKADGFVCPSGASNS